MLRGGTSGGRPGRIGDRACVPHQSALRMHDQIARDGQIRGGDFFFFQLETPHVGHMESAAIEYVEAQRLRRWGAMRR